MGSFERRKALRFRGNEIPIFVSLSDLITLGKDSLSSQQEFGSGNLNTVEQQTK